MNLHGYIFGILKLCVIGVVLLVTACGGGGGGGGGGPVAASTCDLPLHETREITPPSESSLSTTSLDIDNVEMWRGQDGKLNFEPYDIKSGLSYVYGFEVGDFLCRGSDQVSFFESFAANRKDMLSGVYVTGFLAYFESNYGVKISEIAGKDSFYDVWPNLKTNFLLLERGVSVDLNGDGFVDVVKVGNYPGGIFAYINPGKSSSVWKKQVIDLDAVKGPVNIVAIDVNGDHLIDLVVSGRVNSIQSPYGKHMVTVFLREKDSIGWSAVPLLQADKLLDVRTLLVSDFDGDGRNDVIISDISTGKLYIIYDLLNAQSELTEVSDDILMYQAHYGSVLNFKDLSKGLLLPSFMSVNLLSSNGKNWFVKKLINIKPAARSLVVTDVKARDIDDDGELEVFFSVSTLAVESGQPQFGAIYMLKPSQGVYRLVQESSFIGMFDLADFNSDGIVDIVYNNEYPRNSISVLIGRFKK